MAQNEPRGKPRGAERRASKCHRRQVEAELREREGTNVTPRASGPARCGIEMDTPRTKVPAAVIKVVVGQHRGKDREHEEDVFNNVTLYRKCGSTNQRKQHA